MREASHRRVTVEIPWKTLFKIIAAIVLVWLWLTLYQIVLLLVVAVLLAVALDPVVEWLERRGPPRWAAASIVCFVLLAMIGGFVYLTWSSLSSQASMVGDRLQSIVETMLDRLPAPLQQALTSDSGGVLPSRLAPLAMHAVRSTAEAIGVFFVAFILTLYLLIEGRATAAWLVAFVPARRRPKVQSTLVECRRVVFGYVAGNVATSVFATVFVLIFMSVLGVPAALLLAVLAGVCDFVPVVGFIVSVLPAAALAATVSGRTALIVVIGYVAYHTTENYLIAPWVYGDRLKLSNIAVVLAFVVGGALAGIVGAVIALPLAAIYPTIERLWLREEVGEQTVREHREIERRAG